MTKMIKTIALAGALSFATAAAFAGDFDNNEVSISASSGALDFSLGLVGGSVATFETGAYVLEGNLGDAETYTRLSLEYDRIAEDLTFGAEYGVVKTLNPLWTVYGSLEADYVTASADLDGGDILFAPSVGVSRNVGEVASVFAETGYTWNASQDFADNGGYVEVGASFGVAENVLLTPSLVHTVGTGADETNAKLAVSLAF